MEQSDRENSEIERVEHADSRLDEEQTAKGMEIQRNIKGGWRYVERGGQNSPGKPCRRRS